MLEIHFLNVGHGDCTIIRHGSRRISMIDINNGNDIDDDSFAEIRSELRKPTKTLGSIFAGVETPTVPSASQPSLGRLLAAALAARPDKKKQLREVRYDVSLTNTIEFFLKTFPNGSIHRYIQTHPDLDHMRGLAELVRHRIEIVNFWAYAVASGAINILSVAG